MDHLIERFQCSCRYTSFIFFMYTFQQLVRRGIPHPFRGLAWQLLLGTNDSPMKEMYVDYLKQKSPSERMIRRDITRTFPEHDFFKEKNGVGQESLFNVMKVVMYCIQFFDIC